MACGAMQHAVLVGRGRIVVGADGITGAELQALERGCQHPLEASGDLDEPAQRSLAASRRRVDQESASSRLLRS